MFSKEDPRLKVSAHPRRKTSLDPTDPGPLPVSKPFYTCSVEATANILKLILLKLAHEKSIACIFFIQKILYFEF